MQVMVLHGPMDVMHCATRPVHGVSVLTRDRHDKRHSLRDTVHVIQTTISCLG